MGKKSVKFTMEEILIFCKEYNIYFLDDEYIRNNFRHSWLCKKHKETHVQCLDKIKRGGGLKCCSGERVLASNKQEICQIEKDLDIVLLSKYFLIVNH